MAVETAPGFEPGTETLPVSCLGRLGYAAFGLLPVLSGGDNERPQRLFRAIENFFILALLGIKVVENRFMAGGS